MTNQPNHERFQTDGSKVASAMEERGMSERQLAIHSGMSKGSVHNAKNGARLKSHTLETLAEALNKDPIYLLREDERERYALAKLEESVELGPVTEILDFVNDELSKDRSPDDLANLLSGLMKLVETHRELLGSDHSLTEDQRKKIVGRMKDIEFGSVHFRIEFDADTANLIKRLLPRKGEEYMLNQVTLSAAACALSELGNALEPSNAPDAKIAIRDRSGRILHEFDPSIVDELTIKAKDLSNADLSGMRLTGVLFKSCSLNSASLDSVVLERCVFQNCLVESASFNSARLIQCNLADNKFSDTSFSDCIARDAVFRHSQLNGCSFVRGDFTGSDFSFAELRGDFTEAVLLGANLYGVDLTDACLSRADLRQANMTGAKILRADFSYAKMNGSIATNGNVWGLSARESSPKRKDWWRNWNSKAAHLAHFASYVT